MFGQASLLGQVPGNMQSKRLPLVIFQLLRPIGKRRESLPVSSSEAASDTNAHTRFLTDLFVRIRVTKILI